MKYHYFNDTRFPIEVTEETVEVTPFTFQKNGQLWENESILQFYKYVTDHEDGKTEIVIVDIGAQSGLYTLFGKFLKGVRFYSYEPFKTTYKLLKDNVKLNGIEDIVYTYNLAVSDKVGKSTLNVCNTHFGLNTMGSNLKRFEQTECVKVDIYTTTLDEQFYKRGIKVNYIKIDTEGHEYFILKGGVETINKYRPVIQLEWNVTNMTQCNVNERDLNVFFEDVKYRMIGLSGEERLYVPLETLI
jgi:FkbM family methyltransferase